MQFPLQDVKFAARMLRKNLGFTTVALLTLALGIGANSVIFSVVNAVLLRPLPYPHADRLVFITGVNLDNKANNFNVSLMKMNQIQEHSKILEHVGTYFAATVSLTTDREPEAIPAVRASSELFTALGVAPAQGRKFLPEEEVEGAADVVILSDGFWHSHFAGDEAILGKPITLDGKPVVVVGILPSDFHFPAQYPEPDLWLSHDTRPGYLDMNRVRAGAAFLNSIARMRPGVTLTQAQAELDTINAAYRVSFPSNADALKFGLSATPLQIGLVGNLKPGLQVLLAAVGFVLLIACANVANLLIARATAREREMALRKALGASGGRLIRQLLIESVLLSVLGGAIGVLLAAGIAPAVRAFSPGSVPRLAEARLDLTVLVWSLLLSVISGILFGLVPALQARNRDLQGALKEGSRGSSEGGSRHQLRNLLVVAEMAVALLLMTGAGLLIQSFSRLMQVNPGFSSANVMTFPMNLPPASYEQREKQVLFYRQLLQKVNSLPGVESAGVTTYLPLATGFRYVYFCAEGQLCQGAGKDPIAAIRYVSTAYFDAMRTPLLKGRVFEEQDRAGSPLVAIVNQTIADRYWPGRSPLGQHIADSRSMIQREIVGVVADVKFSSLDAANAEEFYFPIEQEPALATTLVVRYRGDPQPLVSGVRASLAALDRNLAITHIAPMDSVLAASAAQPRLILQFVGVFAAFSLLLAAIGIYGVMAYSISARRQEMGIRMSLGAESSDILKLVVGQGMRLALIGVACGFAASLALTRLIAKLLFSVQPRDPLAFAGAAAALLFTALLACYLPARRATRVDPIIVLRSE